MNVSGNGLTLSATTANLINSCAGKVDPKGGPLLSMPPAWNRQRQLWGLWYDSTKFSDTIPVTANVDFAMQSTPPDLDTYGDLLFAQADAPTWWTIDLWGIENTTLIPVGVPGILPLTQSALINQGQRFTRLKARIEWENMQIKRQVDVDIGTGTRISILANAVRVVLLIPSEQRWLEVGTVVNQSRGITLPVGGNGGLATNVLLGGSIYPCFAPLSNRYPTYTNMVAQLATGDVGVVDPVEIPVPPAAKYISIYPFAAGGGATWLMRTLPIASGGTGAVFPLVYDVQGEIQRRILPQNIATLSHAADATQRRFEVVFELEL